MDYPYTWAQAPGSLSPSGEVESWREPDGQHVVAGIGSLGAPWVFASKMARHDAPVAASFAPTWLDDLDSVYSAFVSSAGSIPATVVASPGTRVRAMLWYIDDAQLAALDRTEPNYWRLRVTGCHDENPWLYVAMHGTYQPDRAPIAISGIEAQQRSFASMNQREVQLRLAQQLNAKLDDMLVRHEQRHARLDTMRIMHENALVYHPACN
ncbi:MAG: hypothetical protein ACPHID_04215 [Thermoplasmatota archaeon]